MAVEVYQSCTVDTGTAFSVPQSIWKSGGMIPREAEKLCGQALQQMKGRVQRLQSAENSLYDLRCNGKFLCLTRAQLTSTRSDSFSRSVLFPAGAIDSRSENVLYNPNLFLTFAADNFPGSFEEADAWKDGRESPKWEPPLRISEAMVQAGISVREQYQTLLRCVYAQMNYTGVKPLYVRYDGTWPQMRALLFCIWSGLPWFLRQKFSAVSEPYSPDQDNKYSVVFAGPSFLESRDSRSVNLSKNAVSGNVLTQQMCKRIGHYRYLDLAANLPDLDALPRFYFTIAQSARWSGGYSDEKTQMVYALKYNRKPGDYSNRELVDWVSNALQTSACVGAEMERYLAQMVGELQKKGLEHNLPLSAKEKFEEWKRREEEKKKETEERQKQQAKKERERQEQQAKEERERQEQQTLEVKKRQEQLSIEIKRLQEQLAIETKKLKIQEQQALEAKKLQEQQVQEAKERQERQEQEAKKRQEREHKDGLVPQRVTASERGKNPSARYHIWFPDGTETAEEKGKTDVAAITAADRQDIENIKKAIQTYLKKKDLTIERLQTAWESFPRKELWGYRSLQRAFMSTAWEIYINTIRRREHTTNEKAAFEEYKDLAEMILPDAEDAISDAKLAFWDLDELPLHDWEKPVPNPPASDDSYRRMSFEYFFYEKADFYREVAVEHGNCKLFLDFFSMTLNCKAKQGMGTWLEDVGTFFANHRAIPSDSVQKAKMLLAHELMQTDQFHRGWQWYISWINLAAQPSLPAPKSNTMLWKCINGMYEAAVGRNGENLYNCYRRFNREAVHYDMAKLKSSLVSLLQSICEEYDRGGSFTPLDFWLVLGKAMELKSGCFSVFDPKDSVFPEQPGVNAKVLQMRPIDVMSDCRLLINDAQIWADAQKYELSGTRKWFVRNWLNLAIIERKNRMR